MQKNVAVLCAARTPTGSSTQRSPAAWRHRGTIATTPGQLATGSPRTRPSCRISLRVSTCCPGETPFVERRGPSVEADATWLVQAGENVDQVPGCGSSPRQAMTGRRRSRPCTGNSLGEPDADVRGTTARPRRRRGDAVLRSAARPGIQHGRRRRGEASGSTRHVSLGRLDRRSLGVCLPCRYRSSAKHYAPGAHTRPWMSWSVPS